MIEPTVEVVESLRRQLADVTELCLDMLGYARRDWDWKYDFTGRARELGLISYPGVTTIADAIREWELLKPDKSLDALVKKERLLNVWPDAAKWSKK